ncbi:hypothetical protein [Paramixta manurensis]|uniref:hypothetical protein n=1 Tax=Paramixta manurensis TaxID=2740817 RepID=UPI00156B6E9D
MRQAALNQQQQNSDRNFGLAQEQFGYSKDRDQRNFDYQKGRDSESDRRWGLSNALDQKRLGIAQADLGMRRDELNYRRTQEARSQKLQEEMPAVQAFYNGLQNGKFDDEVYQQISPDNPLNPKRFFGKDAINTVMQFHKVMPQILDGKMDYNDPQALNVLNTVLNPEIQRGIGEKDPATGKTIKSKELAHIGFSADGKGIIPTIKVTYDDGSTAPKPMTRYGSSDPNDTVPVIPIENVFNKLRGYSQMVGQMNDPAKAQFLDKMINPGNKTEAQAIRDYRKDKIEVGKARAKALASSPDDESRAAAAAQFDKLDQDVDKTYGVMSGGDDSSPPDFASLYRAKTGKDPDMNDPAIKDAAAQYQQYLQSQQPAPTEQSQTQSLQKQPQPDSHTASQLRELRRMRSQP